METVVRVAVIYLFLLVGLKLMGKREFSQLSPFEFVTLLIIPEITQQALVRTDFSITNAVIGISTLLMLVFLTSVATYLSRRMETVIDGEPSVIVRHGRLVTETMNRERVTSSEVLSEMHRMGLENLSQVKWGILEADGTINFVRWQGGAESGGSEKRERRP